MLPFYNKNKGGYHTREDDEHLLFLSDINSLRPTDQGIKHYQQTDDDHQ